MTSYIEHFAAGYATSVNSQDGSNDNLYRMPMPRLAFEVGAAFMRAGKDMPLRAVRGPVRNGKKTLSVDDRLYSGEENTTGFRVFTV